LILFIQTSALCKSFTYLLNFQPVDGHMFLSLLLCIYG